MSEPASDSTSQSSPKQHRPTRRKVLKAAFGTGIALLGGSAIYLKTRPSVRLAILGAGIRGNDLADILTWMRRGWPINVEVPYVVDPDRSKAAALASKLASSTRVAQDYREVLADDNVDAVAIATCDHWHAKIAIDAMRSGKAVYGEKPMSITYEEGRQIAEVAADTKSVFQLGTQQRRHRSFRDFAALVLNGHLGEIELVEVLLDGNNYDSRTRCSPDAAPPNQLDWNLWVGPAPYREYCPEAMQGWHRIFQFAGGTVLTWGAHHWDIGNWLLESMYGDDWFDSCQIIPQAAYPETSELYDVPLSFHVEFKIEDRPRVVVTSVPKGESTGLRFTGTKGRAMVNRGRVHGKPYEVLQEQSLPYGERIIDDSRATGYGKVATALHLADFLRCMVDGGVPISNAASSSRSNELLQLTNIACRQVQPLSWNNLTRSFDGNEAATAMLKRPWREV